MAQNPQQAAMLDAQRAAMSPLSFMVGEWEGEGWMDMGQGRNAFRSREVVESRLDGLTLIIEGTHHADIPGRTEPMLVHHAVAMITYDPSTQGYKFNSQVHAGGTGTFAGSYEDGAFIWGMQAGPMQMRYTIRLDDEGRWYEIGERSMDGVTWKQFFEMTLSKK